MSDIAHKCSVISIASDDAPFVLDSGAELSRAEIAFETFGALNERRDNAILVCHALTGSAHVSGLRTDGTTGWWDAIVGAGRAIDTRKWFVICTNVLGGCHGSTGPASVDPRSGRPYGESFPTITIRDMVRAQREVVAHLGLDRLSAVVGGSMGGMQVLEWAAMYPEIVERIVPIATAARHSPWSIGFNAIAREALALGNASGDDRAGLRLARKVAMMTYRSHREFDSRFGRERVHDGIEPVDGTFDVERYLQRHAEKLEARFDVDTYRTITRAMDLHDIAWQRGDIGDMLAAIAQPALCVGISSDVLYPPDEQRQLAKSLANAEYREIASPCGHDAFLIEHEQLAAFIAPFLEAPRRIIRPTHSSSTITSEINQ